MTERNIPIGRVLIESVIMDNSTPMFEMPFTNDALIADQDNVNQKFWSERKDKLLDVLCYYELQETGSTKSSIEKGD